MCPEARKMVCVREQRRPMSRLVELFVANAAIAGFIVHRGTEPAVSNALVSDAAYALADSGSVVLLSSDEPRRQSLLPWVHVTRVSEDRVLSGLAELFERLGPDLPSSVAIVTGPSRSADLEQTLTVGVHGPGEVHVVLLPPGR
jgi:L-lactate utilization protein LutC